MSPELTVSSAAIWHDVECGAYEQDLPLWRTLADACDGPVLDVGCGTGRVALDLAAAGHDVVAVDVDPRLLGALRSRAGEQELGVRTFEADARDLSDLGEAGPFALVIVPMQTVQLLGGAAGRRAFIRSVKPLIARGGLIAIAIADALSAFDSEFDGLPPADELTVAGRRYRSQTLAITEDGGRATIHRVRTVGDDPAGEHDEVTLDLFDPETLESELAIAGYRPRPRRSIAETRDYVGSTVVIGRA